jgi:iron complex outermembrane receptor protein
MKAFRCGALLVVLTALLLPAHAQQESAGPERAVVQGLVTDADANLPVIGANVTLRTEAAETLLRGTTTNSEGRFRLDGIQPGDYVLTATFVGYQPRALPLTLAAGEERSVDLVLQPGLELDPVTVTASRRAEKVADAPASVTVLGAREIESEVTVSPAEVLRTTAAVDIAQTGIDRREVVLRGFNNAFSGSAYVLTDYRKSSIPSLAANAFNLMPITNLDLDQIEVVRGPGSALYGPGVEEGVIHFRTKDPFGYPGTTIAFSGGNQSFAGGELRHAGVIGDRLGYKITGLYSQAEDWPLDPNDAQDQDQIDTYFRDIPRDDDAQRGFVSGQLSYRLAPNTTLTANGGWATTTSTFLSRIGTLQADGFGYAFGQLRLQAGDFFAQAYVNQNDAGDSFVYASQAASLTGATVVDESTLFKTEAQYGLDLLADRMAVTLGADFEHITPSTDGTITGRNEGDDRIQLYGLYAQSETALTDRLALTLATRLDYDNIFETAQLSPRAGLVYKPAPLHSIRATYNRAIAAPSINTQFLDIPAQITPLAAGTPFTLQLQARGAGSGFTFDTFRATGEAPFLLPVPGVFGQPVALDAIPLGPVYGAAANGLVPALRAGEGLPAPVATLPTAARNALADLLGYTAQRGALGAATTGAVQLGVPDDSERGYRAVGSPVDIEPLNQTITQTVELGYKGVIGERVALAVDGYYARKSDFIGTLAVEPPFAYLQQGGLSQDVGAALGPALATSTDPTVRQLLSVLEGQGLSSAQVAQILAGLTGGALADRPTAVVQPDQAVLPPGTTNTVGGLLTYRNFGVVNFFGVDAATQVQATDRISLFGNVSLVSDNYFDNEDLNEDSEDLTLSLNAPRFKARVGTAYQIPQGLSLNVAGRYTEGYRVESGPYIGDIDDAFVLDAGVGYDFARTVPGLRLDVTVQNVLDNDHRQFIGAPKIGRLALARLTYSL